VTATRKPEHGNAGHRGPVSEISVVQYGLNSVAVQRPWLALVVGRDVQSWGLTIRASEGGATWPEVSHAKALLESRWWRDTEDLPGVALIAQGALRKLALDRGWPLV
jgi:hypothetical protein